LYLRSSAVICGSYHWAEDDGPQFPLPSRNDGPKIRITRYRQATHPTRDRIIACASPTELDDAPPGQTFSNTYPPREAPPRAAGIRRRELERCQEDTSG